MKSKRMEFHNKFLIVSVMLAVISWLSLGVVSFPMLAGTLGISTGSAATVVNLISAYSTVTAVISIVGAITGVGSIGSGIAATVLYMLKKKSAAKKECESILGYLNFIGITLLFVVIISLSIYFKSYLPFQGKLFLLFLVVDYATLNRYNMKLPIQSKKINTFYIRKNYIFLYLLAIVKKYYSFQILQSFIYLFVLYFLDIIGYFYLSITLCLIVIQIISLILPSLFSIISKLFLFFSIGLLSIEQGQVVIYAILLNYFILVMGILDNHASNFYFKSSRMSQKRFRSSLFILLRFCWLNKGLTFSFILISILLSYLFWYMMTILSIDGTKIPILFLYTSIYITLMEAIIGNHKSSIGVDLALLQLSALNHSKMNFFFKNAQLMMLTHLISFLQFSLLLCLIPVTSYSNDIKSILLNLLLIPFNYFIAYVYYKKALFLIKGTVSLLRWSFLVLYCFLIIFLTLVGGIR